MILAISCEIAKIAAKLVKITYKDLKKPIINIKEALEKQNPEPTNFKIGNVEGRLDSLTLL